MATLEVPCRYCYQTKSIRKHGTGANKAQHYRCLDCRKAFQLDYAYNAYRPGVKEQIVDMAMNNAGLRNTARVLKVGVNTVLRSSLSVKSTSNGHLFSAKRINVGFGMLGSQDLSGSQPILLCDAVRKHCIPC